MKHRSTFEYVFYAAVFILGLVLRLVNLGALPLSDIEARWALPALKLTLGKAAELGSQPFYELWTSLLFFLFPHSEFIARLIPAVVGSLLVLLPFFLRRGLGRRAALVAAFGLALDPGLVAASHFAGSPLIALSAAFLAIGLWVDDHHSAAVCLAVLAALSGSAFFFGAVILIVGLVLARLLKLLDKDEFVSFLNPERKELGKTEDNKNLLLVAAISLLAGGTLFFRYPQGLAAFARSFPEFIQGWVVPSGVPWLNMVWMLAFFEPLALLLGTMGFVRAWLTGNRLDRWLGLWVLIAWVLCIVHLGRQNLDLIWVLTPLWLLAGRELVRFWDAQKEEILPIIGHTVLLFVLLSLGWLNLSGLIIPNTSEEIIRMRWILILGVLVLSILATILISFGWSMRIAQRGFALGIILCLFLFVMSSTFSIVRVPPSGEGAPTALYPALGQWSSGPITGQSALLMQTISDLALWHTGNPNIVDVAIVSKEPICDTCLPAAALQWALRDITQVRVVDALGVGETPSLVITPHEEKEMKMAEAYRGQSFTWHIQSAWSNGVPIGWMRWLLTRHVTADTSEIVLWARGDVFPGSKPVTTNNVPGASPQESLPEEKPAGGEN